MSVASAASPPTISLNIEASGANIPALSYECQGCAVRLPSSVSELHQRGARGLEGRFLFVERSRRQPCRRPTEEAVSSERGPRLDAMWPSRRDLLATRGCSSADRRGLLGQRRSVAGKVGREIPSSHALGRKRSRHLPRFAQSGKSTPNGPPRSDGPARSASNARVHCWQRAWQSL